jgi:hypothetical protein
MAIPAPSSIDNSPTAHFGHKEVLMRGICTLKSLNAESAMDERAFSAIRAILHELYRANRVSVRVLRLLPN